MIRSSLILIATTGELQMGDRCRVGTAHGVGWDVDGGDGDGGPHGEAAAEALSSGACEQEEEGDHPGGGRSRERDQLG